VILFFWLILIVDSSTMNNACALSITSKLRHIDIWWRRNWQRICRRDWRVWCHAASVICLSWVSTIPWQIYRCRRRRRSRIWCKQTRFFV